MKIAADILQTVRAHAEGAAPRECCGILLAEPQEEAATAVLPAENEAALAPEREYVLGRIAHLRAVRMECRGQARIAGYYHSHPFADERPSRQDLELAVPGTAYLILGRERCAAWRLSGGAFVREPLEVIERHEHPDPSQSAQEQPRAETLPGRARAHWKP